MKIEKNYYRILGVHEKASSHELRKAFCKLTKELHPDTTSLNLEDAKIRLQTVLEAYENLNNPSLRNLYDIQLKNNFVKDPQKNNVILNSYSSDSKTKNLVGNRRPFSNGEMFSLFLLALVIGISLLLAVLFANFAGKEINSIPIWLIK
ncbi:MAG: molecular chaperone DnaJ [Prochlorococcus sp. SP3034]|nr:molecular chaperone DnaJ [Prochlorococcus sp. SP3034]